MRTAPIVSLGLSIVVGIAAVVFGRGWLDSEADAANVPAAVLEQVQTRDILVANTLIERGDLLTDKSFKIVSWPEEHLPEGYLSDTSMLTGADGNFPYALGVMVPGEPLLGGKLSPNAVRDTLAGLIEPGYRAVSIEVDDATGVAGFVLPDMRVDVNVFTEVGSNRSRQPQLQARTLLQDVRVLAVDQMFTESLEGAAPARTVTLQVTPAEARALGAASLGGQVGLALRAKGEVTILPPPPAPRRAAPRRSAPTKRTTTIRVIEGDTETTVTAPVARPETNSEAPN